MIQCSFIRIFYYAVSNDKQGYSLIILHKYLSFMHWNGITASKRPRERSIFSRGSSNRSIDPLNGHNDITCLVAIGLESFQRMPS
jgi:hypothetical protein